MDFIKVSGVDHYEQRLYVHWDVTTICEYKCSYCYARKQYKDQWNRPGNWEDHKYIIDELSKSTLPVFLGLLGGEPTSHKRYFTLLDMINEKVLTHPDSRMYITTNGAKSTEFFDKHKTSNGKTYFLWSLHPEYADFDTFYNNVQLMNSKGYKTKINLMLHPGKRYWERQKEWYYQLSELHYAILHPHFIYHGFDKDVKYTDEFFEEFNFLQDQRIKEFVFEDSVGESYILSDYEIFKGGHNQFKGWQCWHNNFEIRNDGLISDQCFDRQGRQITKDFFKNITEIVPRVCPHNYCSCDGLMKIRKEK